MSAEDSIDERGDRPVEYPPLVVWRSDLRRFRSFAIERGCADTCAAFKLLLDEAIER